MGHDGARLTLGRMRNPVRGLLHGTAAVGSVVGAVALWSRAAGWSDWLALQVFTLSMVTLYTVSSLYHSIPWQQIWQDRMQRLDHAMIYVLVAGTYTPIGFIVFTGWLRWATLVSVWGVAAVGIVQKAVRPAWGSAFSVTLQTVQGWLGVLVLVPLAQRLPGPAVALVVLGGVLYTVGMVAFVTRRPRLWPRVFSYHEVFHLFVVAGSGTHYAMIFSYVAPLASS